MSLSLDVALDPLATRRELLRRHLGLGPNPGDGPLGPPPQPQPLFFIERAPHSTRGAQYLYHVKCFEKIVDFTQADFLDRIEPLTRSTWKLRGINASSVLDGNYLVPGGIERLVLEWKVTRGRWIDKRDGVYDESQQGEVAMAEFFALLRKAGSSEYNAQQHGMPAGVQLTDHEYLNLRYTLAPYESDGPDDGEEWNLFKTYLDSSKEALDNPHDLSAMLQRWYDDVTLATEDEDELDEETKAARERLSKKAIRALQRLSSIPMPQVN